MPLLLTLCLTLLTAQEQDSKPTPPNSERFDISNLVEGEDAPSADAIAEALEVYITDTTKRDPDAKVELDAPNNTLILQGDSAAIDTAWGFLIMLGNEEPSDRIMGPMLYVDKAPTRDGIGRYFFDREIARVMGHLGANWLERPTREKEERTSLLIELLGIEEESDVADIGAGTGYFTFPIAKKAVGGTIYAVDIQPEMLEFIEARKRHEKCPNVTPVLGAIDDVKLEKESIDIAFAVDAYHEFSEPWEMLQSIKRALRPGGKLILVEFRLEDPDVPIKLVHKMSEAQAKRELTAAGFEWVRTDPSLPRQHILIFQKPMKQTKAKDED